MEISAKPGGKAIAFIGLGRMGEAMATNIQRAGYALVVWNRTPAMRTKLRAAIEHGWKDKDWSCFTDLDRQ